MHDLCREGMLMHGPALALRPQTFMDELPFGILYYVDRL